MALEGLFRQVVVLHAQSENGFAVGMRNERVKIIDVEFGFHVQVAMNMAMLAYLKKKVATFDAAAEQIVIG